MRSVVAFRCSCNSVKLTTCFADSFMRVNSMPRHYCLYDNFGLGETRIVDSARTLQYQQLSKQLNCWSLGIETRIQFEVFSSNIRHHCRYHALESSLLGSVAARCASAAWCAVLNGRVRTRSARPNMLKHTLSKQRSYNSSTTTRKAVEMIV